MAVSFFSTTMPFTKSFTGKAFVNWYKQKVSVSEHFLFDSVHLITLPLLLQEKRRYFIPSPNILSSTFFICSLINNLLLILQTLLNFKLLPYTPLGDGGYSVLKFFTGLA